MLKHLVYVFLTGITIPLALLKYRLEKVDAYVDRVKNCAW